MTDDKFGMLVENSSEDETKADVWPVPSTNQTDDNSDMFVEKDKKDERRNEVWSELKANLQEIEKPRNVLLLGGLGTGKSSFINTVITALTGKHRYCANIGSGNKHNSTRLQKVSCKKYWNLQHEDDKALNFPNFIDIIGLDVQLSNPEEAETVNRQIMNLIFNGKLPENADLLDVGRNLKDGHEIEERSEDESLAIDIIVVAISLEDNNIPHALLEEIYTEANLRTRQIPVFAVLTKKDKCDLSQKGFEKKKKDIAESMSIDADKILICENYQPNQKPDSRDVEILEFLTKLCDPCFKAVKLQKIKFKKKQATSTDTDTPSTTPTSLAKNRFALMKDCSLINWVPLSIVVVALLALIIHIFKEKLFR